ncbi:uncharacterized protein LOC127662699 [Xyrauchen texanus]|uniref:uncharacterized protein LOC127662699 n=1 Tax=Xyrauchen texanus TaxID=154827 RepID=UPI002242355A|nr:uncharacterized protein LOC127662699 [Xyrauchen texanus]
MNPNNTFTCTVYFYNGTQTNNVRHSIKGQKAHRVNLRSLNTFGFGYILFLSKSVLYALIMAVLEQPLKQRLKKKLQRFDEKREEWVVGRKKNHNTASIKDEANIMSCFLLVMYEPFLFAHKAKLTIRLKILNGKTPCHWLQTSSATRKGEQKKEIKCEILTPRCTLSTFAQDYLQKIGSFYEYLCEGWTQDSSGNEDQLITLQLTPCEAESTEGQVEQVESTEGQVEQAESTEGQVEQAESTEGQVEQAESTEGQVEQAESTEGQVEQVESTEGQVEQAESTEGQVEQAESTEGQVEQAESTEGQVEQAESTEGQVEQAESTEGQVEQAESTEGQDVFTGSARGTVSKRKKKVRGTKAYA